jgi:hypothetical protein
LNVVNVSYRIGEGIPVATQDLTLALNHLRRHSLDFGLRLDKVVVGGFSAGGQIASTVGFSQRAPDYPFPLNAGIRIIGILSLAVGRNLFPPSSPFNRTDTLRLFTPLADFSDDAPAFFLWHGGLDDQIPPETFSRFLESLARSRVMHRVLFEQKGRHSPNDEQLQEIFIEVFRFLEIASAPAIKRRGGVFWPANVMSARASFAGSPDC